MLRPWLGVLAAALLVLAPRGGVQSASAVEGASPRQAPAPITVDVVVLDRDGRPVDSLTANDFTAAVDGRPRRVLALKHVSRGPGATEAATTVGARAAAVTAAAEPIRSVVIVVDQTLLERGDEAATIRAGGALLDRLGLADRVAIVRVPWLARTSIPLSNDRPSAREDLRAVAGQVAGMKGAEDPTRLDQPMRADDAGRAVTAAGEPDKTVAVDIQQLQIAATDPTASVSPEMQARVRDSLGGLRDLLLAVARVPGRKSVVVFSAGLPRGWNELVRDTDLRTLAAAASAARATVHVIGLRSAHGDASLAPELTAFEALARYAGGAFTMLDKQVDRTIERIMPSLASCYVLSLEPADTDRDGKIHQLKVEATRKGLVVQAPAALLPTSDPDDAVVALPPTRPAAPSAVPAAGTKTPPAGGATNAAVEWLRDGKAAREAELNVVLSRALDYMIGYQQAFSAVVAEETYIQMAGTRRVSLVSDFLLVRPANGETWVSFRDVFQVNGETVRDRENRLKALFLANPNIDESEQLRAIKAESARYNIGGVERNINVPLYALRVLTPQNRSRFRFSLGKTGQSGGVSVQRIEFTEVGRPTIVVDGLNNDNVPVHGSFAIDPLTGAVIESILEAEHPRFNARYDVRYRRDPDLGLWVPEQMSEMYLGIGGVRLAEGQATYSKFRRFQVKTEEKLTIPK